MCICLPDTLTWTVGFVALILTSHPAVTLPGEGDALDGATATGKLPRVAPQLCGTKGQEAIEEVAVAVETWSGQACHHPVLPLPGLHERKPDTRQAAHSLPPQGPECMPQGGAKSCAHNTTSPQSIAPLKTRIFMCHLKHTLPRVRLCAALQSRQK